MNNKTKLLYSLGAAALAALLVTSVLFFFVLGDDSDENALPTSPNTTFNIPRPGATTPSTSVPDTAVPSTTVAPSTEQPGGSSNNGGNGSTPTSVVPSDPRSSNTPPRSIPRPNNNVVTTAPPAPSTPSTQPQTVVTTPNAPVTTAPPVPSTIPPNVTIPTEPVYETIDGEVCGAIPSTDVEAALGAFTSAGLTPGTCEYTGTPASAQVSYYPSNSSTMSIYFDGSFAPVAGLNQAVSERTLVNQYCLIAKQGTYGVIACVDTAVTDAQQEQIALALVSSALNWTNTLPALTDAENPATTPPTTGAPGEFSGVPPVPSVPATTMAEESSDEGSPVVPATVALTTLGLLGLAVGAGLKTGALQAASSQVINFFKK